MGAPGGCQYGLLPGHHKRQEGKCLISSLSTDEGVIFDPRAIQEHIYEFYHQLLGSSAYRVCGLSPDTWGESGCVSIEENDHLALTFSEAELDTIIANLKTETTPGPKGFTVMFFKRCWPMVKHGVLHILNDSVLGRIDISRLSFRILSLIPKVSGAD
jgi:hypothetical protein